MEFVQTKHMVIKWKGERDRLLQRLGGSRAIKHWNDVRNIVSVESCSLSMACDVEEVCSESSRKMQDKEETTSERFVDRSYKRKRKRGVQAWNQRVKRKGPEATVP